MQVDRIDHFVLTVRDIEACAIFIRVYSVVGSNGELDRRTTASTTRRIRNVANPIDVKWMSVLSESN
jgi:hypothetical protein